jgi:hypothetical protein
LAEGGQNEFRCAQVSLGASVLFHQGYRQAEGEQGWQGLSNSTSIAVKRDL